MAAASVDVPAVVVDHVQHADRGADLDFLVGRSGHRVKR